MSRDRAILDRHVADTIEEDLKCFDEQIENHFAHVIMLAEREIISKEDARALLGALNEVKDLDPKEIGERDGLTDLFSNVQEWIIDRLGIDVGGKLHTGRSRNDMNSTIERQYTRRLILDFQEAMITLMGTLLTEAEKHLDTIIPAYTHHSQQAQPVTLGHFCTSYFQTFSRDYMRMEEAYKRVNKSTMGGAAIATTGFPIDRERVAELLGFDGYLVNAMDATGSVDFAYETACVLAILMNDIGRMAESLLLWNLNEVGISRLALEYCSYSTIMPQKRNPVAIETLRGSGEFAYGKLMEMFAAMKAYPMGNGREPGFVVSGAYDIFQRATDTVYLLEGIIRTLEVDKERALKVTADGFSTATDLADMMVMNYGLSFSAAKKIVGEVVVRAHNQSMSVHDIDSGFIGTIAKELLDIDLNLSKEDIENALDPVKNVERRTIPGGPSPVAVTAMIEDDRAMLSEFEKARKEKVEALKEMRNNLIKIAEAL